MDDVFPQAHSVWWLKQGVISGRDTSAREGSPSPPAVFIGGQGL